MSLYGEKKAGGMSYRIRNRVRTSALKPYLEGHDKKSQSAIFRRNQDYYTASADKSIARLKLAQARVGYAGISDKKYNILVDKISHSLNWLKLLKKEIKNATDNQELQRVVSYKKWHTVKLVPSSSEGYAIADAIKIKINQLNSVDSDLMDTEELEDARRHCEMAEEIFMYLLNLEETSDFSNAEKKLLEGFKEMETAQLLTDSLYKTI